jgi:hypothetical protein
LVDDIVTLCRYVDTKTIRTTQEHNSRNPYIFSSKKDTKVRDRSCQRGSYAGDSPRDKLTLSHFVYNVREIKKQNNAEQY